MTDEELNQFIELTISASRFDPNVTSQQQTKYRATITANGGGAKLHEAIARVETQAA